MEAFWFWFVRPIAEFLGWVIPVAIIFGLVMGWEKVTQWWRKRDAVQSVQQEARASASEQDRS